MKALKFVSTLLVLCFVLLTVQVKSQNAGTASDKQKQENLDKIKKHQAEMKKKYNSMTPEQKAEARKKAQYKKSGGKVAPEGSGTTTEPSGTTTKTPVISKTPEQPKQVTGKPSTHSKKPVWMDEKGKAKQVAPVSGEVGKAESKPSTTDKVKSPVVKKKVTPKTKVKTTKQVAKTSAVEGVKK